VNLKTSFILTILFLLLGTFALFDPLRLKEKKEEQKSKDTKALWLKDAKIEWFALNANNIRVMLECEISDGCNFDGQGKWKTIEPAKDKGDAANIGAFLSAMKNLTPVEQVDIEASESLTEYGLDKPNAMVEFKLKGSSNIDYIKLGNASVIGSNVYAYTSMSPQKIFLVASNFSEQMKKDFFHWRNKKFFPTLEANEVKVLSWRNKKKNIFEFEHQGENWFFKKPIQAKTNQQIIDGLLNTILYLQVEKIAFDDKTSIDAKKILQQEPILQVFLESEKKSELIFYKKNKKESGVKEQYYAVSPERNNIALVDAAALDRFNRDLIAFRDRKILSLEEKNSIEQLELHFPKEKKQITLERSGADWKRKDRSEWKGILSQTRIKNFIDALGIAEAVNIVTEKNNPLDKYVDLKLVITKNDKTKRDFRFLLKSKRYAVTKGELANEFKLMGEDFLKVLPIRFNDLEEKANKKVIVEEKRDGQHEHTHSSQ